MFRSPRYANPVYMCNQNHFQKSPNFNKVNRDIILDNNICSNWSYREYLQNNGDTIQKFDAAPEINYDVIPMSTVIQAQLNTKSKQKYEQERKYKLSVTCPTIVLS